MAATYYLLCKQLLSFGFTEQNSEGIILTLVIVALHMYNMF